jgi:lipopolysaccharide transport system permease protein
MTTVSAETSVDSAGTERALAGTRPGSTSRGAAVWAGLVWTLVRTDFKVRYHGTWGGFLWALLKPLAMFVLLLSVFSYLFASDPAYPFNLIIGLFLWDFLAEGTKAGLASLHARGFLLTRARFPSWTLVVTSIANAALTLGVFTVLVLLVLAWTGRTPAPGAVALFLAYIVALALVVVGFSLGASVLFLRYRDLNQVWDLAVQGGFFVAPIIYPLSILPEDAHKYLYLWPPTPIIEFSRDVLVRGVVPSAIAHAMLAGVVGVVVTSGLVVYWRLAPRAAEHV